jgi:hypothetical protein
MALLHCYFTFIQRLSELIGDFAPPPHAPPPSVRHWLTACVLLKYQKDGDATKLAKLAIVFKLSCSLQA